MSSVEEMLVKRLADIKEEMKLLAAERGKVKAALQAVRSISAQEIANKPATSELTFKDKIKIALADEFEFIGATANDILEFCNKRWPDQPMIRSSLSPQLSRLKAEREIDLMGKHWVLKKNKNKGSEAETTEPFDISTEGEDDDPLA
jgi:hypothetical protein